MEGLHDPDFFPDYTDQLMIAEDGTLLQHVRKAPWQHMDVTAKIREIPRPTVDSSEVPPANTLKSYNQVCPFPVAQLQVFELQQSATCSRNRASSRTRCQPKMRNRRSTFGAESSR